MLKPPGELEIRSMKQRLPASSTAHCSPITTRSSRRWPQTPTSLSLIHGYDHPIPDGRGDTLLIATSGPWLLPFFEPRGYDPSTTPAFKPGEGGHDACSTGSMRRPKRPRRPIRTAPITSIWPEPWPKTSEMRTNTSCYGATSCTPMSKVSICWRREVAKQLKDLKIG